MSLTRWGAVGRGEGSVEIGSWSPLSQRSQPSIEASEVNCQHPNQTRLPTTDLISTTSSLITLTSNGLSRKPIMDVDIIAIGKHILAETSPPPHKDFGSFVCKEIKRWTRADLAFCKSLREVCKSPVPNIDEIECLL